MEGSDCVLNRQKNAGNVATISAIQNGLKIWILVLGALAFSGLLLSGCSQTGQATRQHKIVFALFDLSGSTGEQRTNFVEDFKTIIETLDEGDSIIVDKIVDDPLSKSSFPINATLPEFSPTTDNDLVRNKEFDNFKKALSKEKTKLAKRTTDFIMGEKSASTDILSAMYLAERVFNNHSEDKKLLVIFSDMYHQSTDYNFMDKPLTSEYTDEIITSEENNRGLPSLRDVRVYVVGARSSNSRKFLLVRDFWIKYFEGCGALLSKDDYGKRLLTFR